MGLEGVQEGGDALDQGVVDLPLVLERRDLETPVVALLVDLRLLGSYEGALVDIGVDFDIRVIAQLQSVLGVCY